MIRNLFVLCLLLLVLNLSRAQEAQRTLIGDEVALSREGCVILTDPANPSLVYDLNPLSSDVDYVAINSLFPDYKFYINVCKPISTIGGTCDKITGVCESSGTTSTKIGEYTTTFEIADTGSLVMLYKKGTGCNSAKIKFTCDRNAGKGNPVYISESCEYLFEWKTQYACSRIRDPQNSCLFKINGFSYDFTVLNGVYRTSDNLGRTYVLNPCLPLENGQSNCIGGNTYGCQEISSTVNYSIGRTFFNASQESSTKIAVEFGYGDVCINGSPRQFTILYSCGVGLGTPVFVQEVQCHYYFEWKTSLACSPNAFDCVFTISGKTFDFRPLNKTWNVDYGVTRYLLNPCSFISGSIPVPCTSSYGCQTFVNEPGSGYSISKSLSNIVARPSNNSTARFEYNNGDSCNFGSSRRTMFIDFSCKSGSLGVPLLSNATECRYDFTWSTSVAC